MVTSFKYNDEATDKGKCLIFFINSFFPYSSSLQYKEMCLKCFKNVYQNTIHDSFNLKHAHKRILNAASTYCQSEAPGRSHFGTPEKVTQLSHRQFHQRMLNEEQQQKLALPKDLRPFLSW